MTHMIHLKLSLERIEDTIPLKQPSIVQPIYEHMTALQA